MSTDKTQKQDLLVVGELNMDLILNEVESFPELGKEKMAADFNLTLGSSSAIFAGNSSRLGLSTGFCGIVGSDDFGENVVDQLQEYGVDTSLITITERYRTGLTAIIRHSNDRAVVTYGGAMEHFSLADIPDQAFGQARHLHISSIFLQPGIKKDLFEIINKAKSHDMSVSVDTQWDPAEQWDLDFKKLVSAVDFLLPNENEFLNLTNTTTIDEGIEYLQPHLSSGTIIIKQGPKGATYFTAAKVETITGYVNKHSVDTIGAGDSFNAGVIYRFLEGDSIERCIQFGNITGAVSTTAQGGTEAIKSLQHVHELAKKELSITDINDFTE